MMPLPSTVICLRSAILSHFQLNPTDFTLIPTSTHTKGPRLAQKKHKKSKLTSNGALWCGGSYNSCCGWVFHFSQLVEKKTVITMVEKLHETGIGKGLIEGDLWNSPRHHRQVSSVFFGQLTGSFTSIWPWMSLKLNFVQKIFFYLFWQLERVSMRWRVFDLNRSIAIK